MIPGITGDAWEQVERILQATCRDAHHRTAMEDGTSAYRHVRSILENKFKREVANRVDSVREIADELERRLDNASDRHDELCDGAVDAEAEMANEYLMVAQTAIDSIRLIIDPESNSTSFSPANFRHMMISFAQIAANSLNWRRCEQLLEGVHDVFMEHYGVVPSDSWHTRKHEGLSMSQHFAQFAVRCLEEFQKQPIEES